MPLPWSGALAMPSKSIPREVIPDGQSNYNNEVPTAQTQHISRCAADIPMPTTLRFQAIR